MIKNIFLLLIILSLSQGCELAGLYSYVQLADNLFSEKSDFEGVPDTIRLRPGEIKTLNFRLKILNTEHDDLAANQIFIDSDNTRIARVNPTQFSTFQAIAGKKSAQIDERTYWIQSQITPKIEGINPGETFVAIYYKKKYINFKVIVSN